MKIIRRRRKYRRGTANDEKVKSAYSGLMYALREARRQPEQWAAIEYAKFINHQGVARLLVDVRGELYVIAVFSSENTCAESEPMIRVLRRGGLVKDLSCSKANWATELKQLAMEIVGKKL